MTHTAPVIDEARYFECATNRAHGPWRGTNIGRQCSHCGYTQISAVTNENACLCEGIYGTHVFAVDGCNFGAPDFRSRRMFPR